MRHIPEWFPGAGFKTFARVARGHFDVVVDEPLENVKESMKVSLQSRISPRLIIMTASIRKSGGSGNVSIAWSCFDRLLESTYQGINDNAIRAATASMYGGE